MNKFTDTDLFKKCLDRIIHNASKLESVRIMEVCGTHTMEIGRSGLRSILPENVELISGPGCPVCVTPGSIIDTACDLSLKGPVILTFGDMIRVPGNRGSLENAQSNGGRVEALLTPLHAITIAKGNPGQTYIFIAAGFETTIPAIARTIEMAKEQKIGNLLFLVAHRIVPPALSALIKDKEVSIDGFLLPGHVCAISGLAPFAAVLDKKYPAIVTGFEALDIVMSIMTITDMLVQGRAETVNMYRRVVRDDGNPLAVKLIERVFKPVDAVWRGIGLIPQSGLALNDEYVKFDAKRVFAIGADETDMPSGCSCGSVLKGRIKPSDCPLFGSLCTPDNPVGPCMVSTEGSCAAWYKFGG